MPASKRHVSRWCGVVPAPYYTPCIHNVFIKQGYNNVKSTSERKGAGRASCHDIGQALIGDLRIQGNAKPWRLDPQTKLE